MVVEVPAEVAGVQILVSAYSLSMDRPKSNLDLCGLSNPICVNPICVCVCVLLWDPNMCEKAV
jgi:hypothetical protein